MSTLSIKKITVAGICLLFALFLQETNAQKPPKSIYEYTVKTIDGNMFPLSRFKGKKLMIVNVASACGLTPQYKQLQEIYEIYKDKDFEIIAFPSNDFANQEPGSDKEIKEFCSSKFSVSFRMMSKISVKGENKSPVYEWLTTKSLNGKGDYEVVWNFQKFLIDRDGSLYKVIAPKTLPGDKEIIEWINN